MFNGHDDPASTSFGLNFGPSHVQMADGTDALVIRVCRSAVACSTAKNPDMITLVTRKKTPLLLHNTTTAQFQQQWERNTEASIIKRGVGPAEQCGVQDPRLVYDPGSKFYILCYTAFGNPYQKPGAPLTCEQSFTRIVRSLTPEVETSWEEVHTTGPGTCLSLFSYCYVECINVLLNDTVPNKLTEQSQ